MKLVDDRFRKEKLSGQVLNTSNATFIILFLEDCDIHICQYRLFKYLR